MKKFVYRFMALLISYNVFAVDKTWTGTTSPNWVTASSWSPSGGTLNMLNMENFTDFKIFYFN